MDKKIYRIINYCLLFFSCVIYPIHLMWALVSAGQVAIVAGWLPLINYGFAVVVFAIILKRLKKEETNWDITDNVFYILFSLSYLSMIIYVTVMGIIRDMNYFINESMIFLIPLALFGMLWLLIKHKPEKGQIAHIILFSLPLATLLAMVIHVTIVFIKEYIRIINSSLIAGGSAPPWAIPLLYGIIYLIVAFILVIVYFIFYFISTRVEKKKTLKRNIAKDNSINTKDSNINNYINVKCLDAF